MYYSDNKRKISKVITLNQNIPSEKAKHLE